MSKLTSCPHCSAFVPSGADACPCCQAAAPRTRLPAAARALLAIGGGGLLSVTLSACYGGPCAGGSCYEPDSGPRTCEDFSQDTDGDGYCLSHDCDETDPDTHEGATDDVGDGVDQNCDGADGVAMSDAGM